MIAIGILALLTGQVETNDIRPGKWLRGGHAKSFGGAYALRNFQWTATDHFIALANKLASQEKDVYEFGVYTGGSMKMIAERVRGFDTLWGFDSFTGLPDEISGIKREGRHWNPGAFSSADALGLFNSEKLFEQLKAKIHRKNTKFIKGFFNESLTSRLLETHTFKPALIVDVDSDLYVSANECLEWMLRSRLMVPGTLLRYDDWKGHISWGETRAHLEMTIKYGLTWNNITIQPGRLAEFQLLSCNKC